MMAGVGVAVVLMLMPQAVAISALVGLWDFSGLNSGPDASVESVDVRDDPSTAAAVIARLDSNGISSADGSKRFCTWVANIDVPAAPEDVGAPPRGCIYAESGNEIRSVAVFAREGKWLRIAIDNSATRFGWVMADRTFHPLADLVGGGDRLTYLTSLWNRRLYDAPAAKAIATGGRVARLPTGSTTGDAEQPYRAVRTVVVEERLWLLVELLDGTICAGTEPRVVDTGWVPAQSAAGEPWAWFWSRGC